MKNSSSPKRNFRLIGYIFSLFLITRIFLSFFGLFSREWLYSGYGGWRSQWNYHQNKFFDLWGVWDSGWYLDVARNSYSRVLQSDLPKRTCCGQANINFFPLYPLLMRFLGFLTRDQFVSGFIISNLSLLASAILLYKITEGNKDVNTGKKAVKYLFLYPTNFILSGIFSESLFLFFLLLTFYLADRKKWFLSGLAGYFMSLTRPTGLLVFPIILFKYFREVLKYKIIVKKEILFPFLILVGTFTYFAFLHFKFGDFFLYFKVARESWQVGFNNPIFIFLTFFFFRNISTLLIGSFMLAIFSILFFFRKEVDTPLFLLASILLIFPLITGFETAFSFPRHSVVSFPIFMILASISKNKIFDIIFSSLSIFLLIIFMFFWSNGVLII